MAFAAALERVSDPRRNRKHLCAIVVIREQLPPDDAAALTDAMLNPRVTGQAISEALKDEGHTVSSVSIQRHRNGRCLCESV